MKSKLIMGIVSVLLAFGMWVYVITAISPGSEITIEGVKVELEGRKSLLDRDMIIVDILDETVDLQLAGNRSDLVKLDKNSITVSVDVSKIDSTGVVEVICDNDDIHIPNNIASVVSWSPNVIRVQVEERMSWNVPVEVIFEGKLPEGYEDELYTLDYSKIPVLGPKSLVEKLEKAVVTVDLSNQKQTIEETLTPTFFNDDGSMANMEALEHDITQVKLTVPVKRVKTIPILLNRIPGNGATLENTSFELEYDTIKIAGTDGLLEGLDSVTLIDSVYLGEIGEEGYTFTSSFVLPPEVTIKEPENCNKEVDVTVIMSGVKTKTVTIPVSGIVLENLPEDLETYIPVPSVVFEVRGTTELIDALSAGDFTLRVDLSDATVGEKNWPVEMEVAEAYESLWFQDDLTLKISISQIVPETEPEPLSLDETDATEAEEP